MNCPKNIRNGPCGGVRLDGHCEVKPEMMCVWVRAFESSQRLIWAHEIHDLRRRWIGPSRQLVMDQPGDRARPVKSGASQNPVGAASGGGTWTLERSPHPSVTSRPC